MYGHRAVVTVTPYGARAPGRFRAIPVKKASQRKSFCRAGSSCSTRDPIEEDNHYDHETPPAHVDEAVPFSRVSPSVFAPRMI